jgi:hypothetical protein
MRPELNALWLHPTFRRHGGTAIQAPRHQANRVFKGRPHCTRHGFAGKLVVIGSALRAMFAEG